MAAAGLLASLASLAVPPSAAAQGFVLAVRAGTTGVGPEASVRMGSVVLRGAYGLLPLTLDVARHYDLDGLDQAKIELPGNWVTAGADLVLGGFFRIGAGVLYKPGDFKTTVTFAADSSTIGGQSYAPSEITALEGAYSSRSTVPFAAIGFGTRAPGGFGVFVDLGVAFVGDAALDFSAKGDPAVIASSEFQDALDREARRIEDKVGRYLKYWPILNVGLRFGFGFG